ncbi:MAG: ammonium transporter [Cyanobacteriota bacterium]|nr:ammonium transporter [Cyanobacteriota bacterium]
MLDLDVAWTMGCAGLVFLMQPGFMCLECGLTRSKNSINVAVKNLADFGSSVILFWTFGYAIMFGTSIAGWVGSDSFLLGIESDPKTAAFFIFQVMFCGTTTTIVSGAVAERMRFSAYLIVALIISGFIYPLFGHWAWNGLGTEQLSGWLGRLGFFDFAGSTVVHSLGGWVSLAALLVVGPRTGRFSRDGSSNAIHGSNLPFSVLGVMLLWLGWLGFNGGSTLALNNDVPKIIVHTIVSGATAMLAAAALSWWQRQLLEVETLINGSLAGMVSITACCSVVTTVESAAIGIIGGILMLLATRGLERRRIDDGVDAVAIHGVCGAWGTLAVALFGDRELIGTGMSSFHQFWVQLFGIGVCWLWAFGVTYLLLRSINRAFPLRVSVEEEELGLNVSEHQAKTEVYDLFQVMDAQARTKDFSLRVPEEPYTEVGKIARRYNQVMAALEEYAGELKALNGNLEKKVRDRTAELARANEELKRLDKLKDQFLANTSHELRTPLNATIGLTESMLDGATGDLSPPQRQNLWAIAQSGRRLLNLVNDILDFSTLKEQTLELNLQPVALRSIADIVLALGQSLVGKKNLKLVNAIPVDLPLVRGDTDRLQQILYNLVGNGIKFSDRGVVTVSAQQANPSQIQVEVSDTGVGISREKLHHIFESFEQGDGSTARTYGGTGLGLAVTRQLVQLHGGEIWAESEVEKGSRFMLTLPVFEGEEGIEEEDAIAVFSRFQPLEEKEELATSPLTSPNTELNPFKVLIVDDEPLNLQVLLNHLALEDYALTQASNGVETIAIIEAGFKPDLILLDVMMPNMTGYEVTQKLREQFPPNELPILLVTAKDRVADIVEGLSAGANDYLTKPIHKPELLARLKTHLNLSRLNNAYSYFVPRQFLQILKKQSIIDIALGDRVEQEMSVLFSDIRGFTSISEKMTPEENLKFINGYLLRMEPAIVENSGFIDKFIGDAIMALFGQKADDAVKAGIAMLNILSEYNTTRHKPERPPLKIGIGINTGSLMLGTIGGNVRMEGTVIGDTVNLASRIEALTKYYGVHLLMSEHTFLALEKPSAYNFRLLDRVKVKGKSNEITLFEIFEADPPQLREAKIESKTKFERGVVLFHQKQFAEARHYFENCLDLNSGDRVARIYLQRCKKGQSVGIGSRRDRV